MVLNLSQTDSDWPFSAGNQRDEQELKPAGITLSPQQVERGSGLAAERGLSNASFQVMDAQAMTFPDNTFDLVWACESGEHMPDKQKYIQEMERVLKPGLRTNL